MRKKLVGLAVAAVLTTVCSMTAFAGEWQKSLKDGVESWWYDNQNGTYAKSGWSQIDGVWYYFDEAGWMLANTTTPDGYQVGASGAWIDNTMAQEKKATTKPVEWDSSWERKYPTGVWLISYNTLSWYDIIGASGGGLAGDESECRKYINDCMNNGQYVPAAMYLCLDCGFNTDKVDWYKSQGYISPQYQLPEKFYEITPNGKTECIDREVYRGVNTNCRLLTNEVIRNEYDSICKSYIPKFVLESRGETFETYYEATGMGWYYR
ncbi:hypothetical protein [[Clostridium] aminophilum]|uniref:hypothetical protein n=1 Tax=[Clostridium] aminophilum TaxID=1526 RepID=UPI00331D9155